MGFAAQDRPGIASLVSTLIFLAYAAITLATAVTRPIANWDMLAYQASVLDRQGTPDSATLHRETFERVRAAITDGQFRELTGSDAWRERQARDSEAFRSMLPMYEVKGGYIALLTAVSTFTETIQAARAISLVSVGVIFAVLAFAFWRLGALRYLVLTVPVLAVLRFADLASITAPDPLAIALAFSALTMIAARGVFSAGPVPAVLVALSVWMRPDMLVVAAGLPVALAVTAAMQAWREGTGLLRAPLAAGIWPWLGIPLAFGAYQLAKWGVAHPGWWVHFNFSIIAQQESMAGFNPAFSWGDYLRGVIRGVLRTARDETWPWLMLAMLFAGRLLLQRRRLPSAAIALVLVAVGSVAARLVVFPLGDSRLAVLPLLAMLLAAAACARPDENDVA